MRFRRRKPTRRPHPDPRIEAELQRIIWLRANVDEKEADLARARMAIRRAGETDGRDLELSMAAGFRADGLRRQAAALEREIPALHDEIAARIAALDGDDLLWLDPDER